MQNTPTPASALDKSIIDLAERHNLLTVSVDFHRASHGIWFTASLQWADSNSDREIANFSADTYLGALNGAIAAMLEQRGQTEIPTDALELVA